MNKTLFICVGAQKAGTTWLSKQLENHPKIFTPYIKELHYFDILDRKNKLRIINKRIRLYKRHVNNLALRKIKDPNYIHKSKWLFNYCLNTSFNDEWYKSLFDLSHHENESEYEVVIDNTPEYSILSIDRLKQIKAIAKDVKVVFILRDPISRTWSAIKYFSKNNPEKSILNNYSGMVKFVNLPNNFNRNNYPVIIKRINSIFSEDNVLLSSYENIFVDENSQLNFLQEVCSFLKLDYSEDYFKSSVSNRVNFSTDQEMTSKTNKLLSKTYNEIIEETKKLVPELTTKW